ncbi:hypothetical protein PbB2_02323 [Candidatus Phycosocius bacilliformis]|uniref:Uncharacterized protein n=1 Tax=Candidatus Phycosocius bacilliformis TaxID=1445552 RepID=A0A2P2EC54_9PROT|nr:hypothetical protein PbB2_02323 [Candidatus Phycosocius bacilliformis]
MTSVVTKPQTQLFLRHQGGQVSVFCENRSHRDAAKLRT